MKKRKTKSKSGLSKNRNLTTDCMKEGFKEIILYYENEIDKHKRRLGVAPGERLLIKWK